VVKPVHDDLTMDSAMPELFLQLREPDDTPGSTPAPLNDDEAIALLGSAEFVASQLIPWGSNYSFAVAMMDDAGREQLAIYKPRAGEAPLYDFPTGTLYLREVASYRLSRLLGWNLVPPTIIRDGPRGIGSLQLYIEPARAFWGDTNEAIERLVLFDHVANNADRKLGHCLRDGLGRVWGIDHGLTFNEVPKLRTVLWQFVGEPISPPLLREVRCLRDRQHELPETLGGILSRTEVEALTRRITQFAESGCYPVLNPRRNIPYGWW
jgi:hypothetical protein